MRRTVALYSQHGHRVVAAVVVVVDESVMIVRPYFHIIEKLFVL